MNNPIEVNLIYNIGCKDQGSAGYSRFKINSREVSITMEPPSPVKNLKYLSLAASDDSGKDIFFTITLTNTVSGNSLHDNIKAVRIVLETDLGKSKPLELKDSELLNLFNGKRTFKSLKLLFTYL